MKYWNHPTRIGRAYIICRSGSSPWRIEIDGEDLGGYATPESALDDLIGGHTFSHSRCVDTSSLGLPDDLSEWEFFEST